MATVTTTPTSPLLTSTEEPRFLIQGLSWDAYERIVQALEETHVRATYDSGALELMSPSPKHESFSRVFFTIVQTLADEFDMDFTALGSTTFKSEVLGKGLEPDECFYLTNWAAIADKEQIDLEIDPPPDLAIEIEITSSMIPRLPIYQEIGVPEIWRFDGVTLTILNLSEDGSYQPARSSRYFPPIDPAAIVVRALGRRGRSDRVWLREFRAWVREQLGRPA